METAFLDSGGDSKLSLIGRDGSMRLDDGKEPFLVLLAGKRLALGDRAVTSAPAR